MDVKEYLLTSKLINRAEIARLMWPDNTTAKNYLNAKLHNLNGRRFTRKDALSAQKILIQHGISAATVTVADKY